MIAVVSIAVAVVLVAAAFRHYAFTGCVLTEAKATDMVMAELKRAELDPKYLTGPTQAPGSCSLDFYYDGEGRQISYVAIEDSLHGPELHRWDYAKDANGP